MKSPIKKYIPFFKAGAMSAISYRFSFITWLIVTALEVLCTVFLWVGVYQNASEGPNSIINGFSFHEMLCYVVFSSIFRFVSFNGETLWMVHKEVKDGTIAVSFVKPISYRIRFIFTTIGIASIQILLIGIPLFSAAYLTFYLLGYIVVNSFWEFLAHLLLFLLAQWIAILLMDSVDYFCGILTFYTTASWGINAMKNVIIGFLSGSLIPLSFFPAIMGEIIAYSPFAGMVQNPVLILMMKLDYFDAIKVIGISLAWLIILELFAKLLFAKASKKVTVQGG